MMMIRDDSDDDNDDEHLYTFLLGCKVDKGCEHTHTSFQRPVGAFYIPSSHHDHFMTLYAKALGRGEDLYLTEKHRHLSPLLIDLDFRFREVLGVPSGNEQDQVRRRYTLEHVKSIVYVYGMALKGVISLPADGHIDFYVMEKTRPSRVSTDVTLTKDGLHIVCPGVVTRASVQYLIRRRVLPLLAEALSDLQCVNTIDDIVDEAVVERNNWMMYGSKKPGGEAYKVTRVLRFAAATDEVGDAPCESSNPEQARLVNVLSIRNKYDEVGINETAMAEVQAEQGRIDERQRRRDTERLRLLTTSTTVTTDRMNTCVNKDTVERLVDVLSPERAEAYDTWIRLGFCLRNIDHRLLPKWVEFSKTSSKYKDGECERIWNHMRPGGLGIGTLNMWARKDNPDAYRQIVRSDLMKLIKVSLNGTHHDVAKVVYHLYKYDYVCASIRNKCWYEFRDHRWRQSDCAYTLRMKMSTDIVREYDDVLHGPSLSSDEDRKKVSAIMLKLKTTSFKDNVMKECGELFYHEKFEEKLDSNCHLIGFENGVYDLDAHEFREGRPDDFVSYSTGINYVPYDAAHPAIEQIMEFLRKVLPKEAVRNYVLRVLSSALNGNVRDERFHVWTGSGSNGKSKTIELFEKAFGEYCCKFPVTLLTQKRAASNAASSEIARAKGKRFGVLQEPSEDEKLNIGLMKELTGGDRIMTRKLYSEPQEWKPQWTLALLCNHLPNVPSDDGGTWRRIRVVEFNSKFVEVPNPDKANEFAMDTDISGKFELWKEVFMSMLIEQYKTHAGKRMVDPEEVTACTREYQKNNDHMADFVDTCLVRSQEEGACVSVADVFQELKDWIREDNIPCRAPKKKEVTSYLDKNIGRACSCGGRLAYKGYVIRDRSSSAPYGGGAGDD